MGLHATEHPDTRERERQRARASSNERGAACKASHVNTSNLVSSRRHTPLPPRQGTGIMTSTFDPSAIFLSRRARGMAESRQVAATRRADNQGMLRVAPPICIFWSPNGSRLKERVKASRSPPPAGSSERRLLCRITVAVVVVTLLVCLPVCFVTLLTLCCTLPTCGSFIQPQI